MKRTLGVCYYPEHWPEDQWTKDAKRMVDAGLSWVRIGEFAWSRYEQVEGTYDFDWLDRAIDVLGSAGLKVILGTPTATPPIWVVEKHPDMLAVDENGHPRKFGSRRHYCFSHEGYKDECRKIVRAMAQRYGKNPYIAAWQTDNEYACHDTTVSYSNAARIAFQNWCTQRYQSTDALNTAWGNVFWSMEYSSFDQIDLPNLTVTEPNHPHVLAFKRFSSDQVVAFNKVQTDILRDHTDVDLIHNYMGREMSFDHYDVGADLDIASWDSYPIGFLSDRLEATDAHKSRFLKQGDPDFQAFHHDIYRAVGRGRWWIMEQQPGPVNWAPYNPAPLPGMARLWTWEAFAHGAETVCYFRWRQAPWAQEQMHAGLLRPDSIDAPAMAEAIQVAKEIESIPDVDIGNAQVGLVFDWHSAWAWEAQPQGADFDYFRLTFEFYRALRKEGLSVDILPPDTADLSAYKFIVAPGLLTISAPLRDALKTFKGTTLLGPRTDCKTNELSIPSPMGPNIDGLDTTAIFVESLPPSETVALEQGGVFRHWVERLDGSSKVTEQTIDGHAAIVSNGQMHYIAGWPDDVALSRIIRGLCATAGVETTPVSDGLRIRDTKSHRFVFNYAPEAADYNGVSVPAAGVYWTDLE